MRAALAAVLMIWAGGAQAHPHVFVETRLEILVDDRNRATGVRISWTYDDMTSLALIVDRGLDPDFDGVLTPEEQAQINGFDMHWPPDVAGDTYALLGDKPLTLSRPVEWTTAYTDARLTSTHLRVFDAPVEVRDVPLVIQAYDSGYYTAYTVEEAKVTGGTGCSAEIFVPDPEKADQTLIAALAELSPSEDAEVQFPAVGAAFAEEARVTCPAP